MDEKISLRKKEKELADKKEPAKKDAIMSILLTAQFSVSSNDNDEDIDDNGGGGGGDFSV